MLQRELRDMNVAVNPDPHIVELTLNLVSSWYPGGTLVSSDTSDLAVYECLPFRGTGSSDYSYPYNSGANDFMTNHICCSGDLSANPPNYELEGTTTNCFSGIWFGELNTLRSEIQNLGKSTELQTYFSSFNPVLTPPTVPTPSPSPAGNPNDIYKLVFNRNCDGNRGNICAGTMTATLARTVSCGYINNPAREQCSGPAPPGISQTEPTVCHNYQPGETFESLFGLGGNGVCNDVQACSNVVTGTYGAPGVHPQLCQATCDGTGSCDNARDQECSCSQSCGAQCYPGKSFEWIGYSCAHSCDDAATCTFASSTTLKCQNGPVNYCLSTKTVPGVGATYGWCYDEVTCNAVGGSQVEGQPCQRGLVRVNTNPSEDLCMWGSSAACLSDGSCTLSRRRRADVSCTGTLSCNMNVGWVCTP
jgi:hypothetical protein